MSALPAYATLGIDQPLLRVLEWYLACALPSDYEAIQRELRSGREIINPVDAFERIVRNNQPIPSYKTGLDYANNCFPRHPDMAKEAARWMLRWEPELTKPIGQTLLGEKITENTSKWTNEKHMAFAMLAAQMMATNWENKTFVERWKTRLSYRNDITDERRQVAAAKAYWTLMGNVHPDWTSTVWSATLARTNPKNRASLEDALAASHNQLQQRAPSALPGLPTQALVAPPRIERGQVVPGQ